MGPQINAVVTCRHECMLASQFLIFYYSAYSAQRSCGEDVVESNHAQFLPSSDLTLSGY
jgi:hypothetical protein